MHIISILAAAAALPCLVLAKPNEYCQGDFASTEKNCGKFKFGPPKKSECSKTNIVKLSNCTTSQRFYDISKLPDQTIDQHTTKMAELITNV
ncbi:hypothetical protein DFQ28_003314 [Apophysomyces sp. BC1034]|nr:hypothetical protein DFQ29_007402 [Apophysomyces sp. BC1021]KAG0189500.1 hypothetical protein DFQ28_003314 [Apophysomyces sp. BC1034]